MLNKGMQICIHIAYEQALLTNSSKPAIIRDLAKTWQLTTLEVEEIIKEEDAFLESIGQGMFA